MWTPVMNGLRLRVDGLRAFCMRLLLLVVAAFGSGGGMAQSGGSVTETHRDALLCRSEEACEFRDDVQFDGRGRSRRLIWLNGPSTPVSRRSCRPS